MEAMLSMDDICYVLDGQENDNCEFELWGEWIEFLLPWEREFALETVQGPLYCFLL